MPNAKIELGYRTPLELLVSVILSAQCTDRRVNMVTPALFARYPTAEAYARASRRELEGLIKTCGLYRSKAKSIIAMARSLVRDHGGRGAGAGDESRAADPSWSRPKKRRGRQHPLGRWGRPSRRYAYPAAGLPPGLHPAERSRQGGDRLERAFAERSVGESPSAAHLAWPP